MITKHIAEFQKSLETQGRILRWQPTASELRQIASELCIKAEISESISIADLQNTIAEYVSNVRFVLEEGIDNSDLKQLLALAKKVDNQKD